MGFLDTLLGRRESVHITAESGLTLSRKIICHRCEREIDERHEVEGCAKNGMSRRFFFGLAGASAAALALRLEGVPIPQARIQVIAYAGDMFEVETLNPFTIAWEGAKTRNGNPFKADDGLIQDGGLLEFHGQDVSRPDKWLRVHRGLSEMNVLGLVDKATGKPIKYRIVRSEEADKRVGIEESKLLAIPFLAHSYHSWNTGALAEVRTQPLTRVPFICDIPQDTDKVDRIGVKYAGHAGFKIKYTAGKSQELDSVRIIAPTSPKWFLDLRKDASASRARQLPYSKDPEHKQFTGNLHNTISMINKEYPDHAQELRLKIMSCNPEYRRRVAPVRSVKTIEDLWGPIAGMDQVSA